MPVRTQPPSQSARCRRSGGGGLPAFSSCVSGCSQRGQGGVARATVAAPTSPSQDESVGLSKVQPESDADLGLAWIPVTNSSSSAVMMMPIHVGMLGRGERSRRPFVIAAVGGVETDYGRDTVTVFCPPLLLRSPARGSARFLARRVERCVETRQSWRSGAERALRLVGRRFRPDAVHPLDLPAPRGRLRWRRPARSGQFRRRRPRLDRELSEPRRLAGRRLVDDRGQRA